MEKADVQEKGSLFIYSDEMGRFDFGQDHPFKPERAIKTYDLCSRFGVMNYQWMKTVAHDSIDPELLLLFHEKEYLDLLKEASKGNVNLEMLGRGIGTDDTPIIKGIYEWSLKAAGGTYSAMQSILNNEALVAFNTIGGFHHAMPGNAEGFCYINDIVLAIKGALNSEPDLKIAYVDFDAHHGNGVQHAFYDDPRVFVISLHETGESLYPWSGFVNETGEGKGLGYTVNFPLEQGSDDEVYGMALDEVVFPLLNAFSPDIIVAEMGADALVSDPLTHLKLTNNCYQTMARGIVDICSKILCLGGGGYDLYKTSRCWTLVWSVLNNVNPEDEFAGLVGGMMFGPEHEVGSLYDHSFLTKGEVKEKAMEKAGEISAHIKKEIFPMHGLAHGA